MWDEWDDSIIKEMFLLIMVIMRLNTFRIQGTIIHICREYPFIYEIEYLESC